MADTIRALYMHGVVVCENSSLARQLYDKSRFGSLLPDGRVELSLIEALYLSEKGKLEVVDSRGNPVYLDKKLGRSRVRYIVYRDLRSRGYIVKTALKFGADFRVYGKGVTPGKDHAKWVVFCVRESDKHTWHEFSAKGRVAHSTKKKLLMSVVDDEGDVSYWEVGWIKP